MKQMMRYKHILIVVLSAPMKLFGVFSNFQSIQETLQLNDFRFICLFNKMLSSQVASLSILFLKGQVLIKQCLLNGSNATRKILMHENFAIQNFQASMYGMLDKKNGLQDQRGLALGV
jgi:hypothetical protein